mgnify:CR=1 FL=1
MEPLVVYVLTVVLLGVLLVVGETSRNTRPQRWVCARCRRRFPSSEQLAHHRCN